MAYRELPAPGRPAPHVACLWLGAAEAAPRVHRIVPAACADIVWVQGERLVVAGPATGPVLSPVPAGAAAAGVRVRVGAAASAVGVPAGEVRAATVARDVVGALGPGRLQARLDGAATPDEAAAVL